MKLLINIVYDSGERDYLNKKVESEERLDELYDVVWESFTKKDTLTLLNVSGHWDSFSVNFAKVTSLRLAKVK